MSFSESLASLITPSKVESLPDLSSFNAKPLQEAIQRGLENTDGCFICFGGSTLLCGVLKHGFFMFDSHSRTPSGKMTANGNSLCKSVKTVDDVHLHIIELKQSMGLSNAIECEITGISIKQIGSHEDTESNFLEAHSQTSSCGDIINIEEGDSPNTEFVLLTENSKLKLCSNLQIPVFPKNASHVQCVSKEPSGPPLQCHTIIGDGNCFFRAISFSLTGSEDAHEILRSKMCKHINENPTLFKGLLRSSNQSLENYIKKMNNVGTWATEFEIIAMSHMLQIHIFTYSDYAWKRYSGSLVDSHFSPIEGKIEEEKLQMLHLHVLPTVA